MCPARTDAARVAFAAAHNRFPSAASRVEATRVGWSRARHRISSLSMFPRPASSDWSMRTDLELLPRRAEDGAELVAGEAERVGSEVAEEVVALGVVGRQPDAAQLATVDEAQGAPVGDEVEAAEPVVVGLELWFRPVAADLPAKGAGHAQVDEDGDAVGADRQPLAPARRAPDVAPDDRVPEPAQRGVAQR